MCTWMRMCLHEARNQAPPTDQTRLDCLGHVHGQGVCMCICMYPNKTAMETCMYMYNRGMYMYTCTRICTYLPRTTTHTNQLPRTTTHTNQYHKLLSHTHKLTPILKRAVVNGEGCLLIALRMCVCVCVCVCVRVCV